MGTRSLTFVHEDRDSEPVVCIYRQYDGYFSGMGEDILTFLKGGVVVNGIGGGPGVQFNGSGDLAARLITMLKDGDPHAAGNVYIKRADLSDDDMGAEFSYHIYCRVGQPPYLVARDGYAGFTVEGSVDSFAWPEQDDEGNYVAAAAVDTSGPLTEDQRRALFASFMKVFGTNEQDARLAFTRRVLRRGDYAAVSWSPHKEGTITSDEASRLLDVLSAIEATAALT